MTNYKKYIMTITYNFDLDYVCKEFNSEEEAIQALNSYLEEEIKTISYESEYNPTVIRHDDWNVDLIYDENATYQYNYYEPVGCDVAFYKVMEVNK